MKKKIIYTALSLMVFILPLFAEELYPPRGWKDRLDPLASQEAVTGGEILIFAGQYPKSLNYYLDNNVLSAEIFSSMYDTLLGVHPLTLDHEPGLASAWSISSDKTKFTFYIDKNALWSNNKPVTAYDVKFTYDVIMNPKNLTGPHKVEMERFYPPVIIDERTISFTAKDVHWKNLGSVGGLHILPENAMKNMDFNKINFSFPVVSGACELGKISEGISIALMRRENWWRRNRLSVKSTGNFEILKFKFYAERENAFEAFKKGRIDIFPVYTSRIWVNETGGDKFLKNWIVKQKIHNCRPVGFQGFAMNLREFPFDDKETRMAMCYLLDRKKMNTTLMYDQYFLHKSYVEDLYTRDNPCKNPPFKLDRDKAGKLLKNAGWIVNPKTGFLEKNKKKFSFKFLTRNAGSEKFISIYAQDLKDAGIELIINKKDWAAWARDMDEFNFQMTWAAWGSGIFKDPEGMWSSKEASRKGGSNITGLKNSRVDELIDQQKHIFDVNKRNEICRDIDKIVYNEYPYVLLWNIDYTRLLYWNKFGTPDSVLSKYGDERSAYWYWWLDEDSRDDLKSALEHKNFITPKQPAIDYFK